MPEFGHSSCESRQINVRTRTALHNIRPLAGIRAHDLRERIRTYAQTQTRQAELNDEYLGEDIPDVFDWESHREVVSQHSLSAFCSCFRSKMRWNVA